jgi:hypothetical protein
MIDPNTGRISLSDDEMLAPNLSEGNFQATFADAQQEWSHNTRSAYKIFRSYESGWSVEAAVHFEEDLISIVLLAFNDGTFDEDEESDEQEERRTKLHDGLLREWLGQAKPYHFDWGVVQLLSNSPYSNRYISVQYN